MLLTWHTGEKSTQSHGKSIAPRQPIKLQFGSKIVTLEPRAIEVLLIQFCIDTLNKEGKHYE